MFRFATDRFGHMLVTAFLVTAPNVWAQEIPARELEFFESKIRPVLVEHCYKCHSADSEELKGGLAVDTAAALRRGGDSGPAVIPEKPESSPLIEALRYDGLEMPPDGRLPSSVVRDFEKWVRSGAADPRSDHAVAPKPTRTIDIERGRQFWAFRPFRDSPRPDVGRNDVTAIDAFIEHRLAEQGLSPAPAAGKHTLIRRLYFDLTGLPPTADVLANADEVSIDDLLDQLMQSPQFGVHWGRHWLDVARYADSNGGDFNATFHNAWKYRDYVVDSMNADKPFDRFIREQIAGDLLPFENDQQRTNQIVATGFLMLGTKMLSERDKEKLTMDVVDEQINTVGSAFLGMTLGCARCHDHKFDPIPTRDYYAMAGIFRSTRTLEGESQKYVSTWRKTDLPVSDELVAAHKAFDAEKKVLDAKLKAAKKTLAELEAHKAFDPAFVVDDTQARLIGEWKTSTYSPGYVGKGYIHDDRKGKGRKAVEFSWVAPVSGRYEVRVSYTHNNSRARAVPITVQHAGGASNVTLDQRKRPTLEGMFAAIGRYEFEEGRPATVHFSTEGTKGHVIVDAVWFARLDKAGDVITTGAISGDQAARLESQRQQVKTLDQQVKALQRSSPEPLPKAFAAGDLSETGDCEVRVRGEHRNLGASVPRGFLQVVDRDSEAAIADKQSGRRELAEWIARADNPLTARVIVNRVWSHLIGQGLVRSIDNFGQLGQPPTHPQLLDHLAARFVTPVGAMTDQGASGLGWSIKGLIREIVRTRVYQQSSRHDESAWGVDPENRLLWKAHRRRIPAEGLRDAILAISGRLELSPGGSPVEGLGTLVKNNQPDAAEYQQQESSRRSLYLPIIRNELPPILTVFDFADPDLVVGKRPVTNVPAQALFLMNSPFVMANAATVGQRLGAEPSEPVEKVVARAYLEILARPPGPVEVRQAVEYLKANEDGAPAPAQRLARFVHVLFASTEFRMLD